MRIAEEWQQNIQEVNRRILMKKLFAVLVGLAMIGGTAFATDRAYSVCDAAKSRLCALVGALYEFEETSNSIRPSEVPGAAPFLEPNGGDVAQGTTGKIGHDLSLTTSQYVYIPRTASLGGSFTINLWVKWGSGVQPANNYPILWSIDAATNAAGSRLYWSNASGVVKPVFLVIPGDGSSAVTATWSSDLSDGVWHMITFGAYADPIYTNLSQYTIWVSVDNGTRVTATVPAPPLVYLGDFKLGAPSNIGLEVDQLSVFSGRLLPNDITYLYNSGNGRAYPFTANQ